MKMKNNLEFRTLQILIALSLFGTIISLFFNSLKSSLILLLIFVILSDFFVVYIDD
jgi:hypothetical protein